MAKKEVVFENDRYKGKKLDSETCMKLEQLLRLDEAGGYVKDLKNCIFDLPSSSVETIRSFKSGDVVELERGELTDMQTIGVAYMYFAKSLILGDSVGLGKTIEVCGLCNVLETALAKEGYEFRFLYLTNKNLLGQAQKEFIRFTGNYVTTLQGLKDDVQKFIKENSEEVLHSVVGSHSLLTSVHFQDFMRYYEEQMGGNPFDLLVIDESGDILKNTNTKTYKDAKVIADMFDRVILLNATPFEKELRMFYSQLNFIDSTLLPTKTDFSKEYEIMDYSSWRYPVFSGKYKNAERFRDLVSYRYLSRTRKSIGAYMKNCTAKAIIVPLSKEQKYLLSVSSMPTMVYDCPSYFDMGVDTDVDTTPKLRALLNLIDGEFSEERSILVYARYKEAQSAIKFLLDCNGIDSRVMNGETPRNLRERFIDSFKLGEYRVLVTNVQKGLNFGNCNVCIFYDYDPNPNNMVQFEGRMTRTFNIEGKHVRLIVSEKEELKTFKNIIADRAKASDLFAGSDFSCVMSLLLKDKSLFNAVDEEEDLVVIDE